MGDDSTQQKRRGPGRPRREGGPRVHVSVRLDQLELDAAKYHAALEGVDLSEYIRRAVVARNDASAARLA